MKEMFGSKLIDISFTITLIVVFAFSNFRNLSIFLQFSFVLISIYDFFKTGRFVITNHFYWMFSFLLWCLIGVSISSHIAISLLDYFNLSSKFIFYTCLIDYSIRNSKQKTLLKLIVLSSLVLITRLLIYTPISLWGTERLGESIDVNPNLIGMILSFASIISLHFATQYQSKKYYIFVIILLVTALFTGSRKAILMIGFGIIFYTIVSIKNKKNFLKNLVFVMLVSISLTFLLLRVPIIYEVIGSRISSFFHIFNDLGADKSTITRSLMIKEALDYFYINPFFGYGLDTFKVLSSFGVYSHNNYVELLFSTGFIGFIIYYTFLARLLFHSIKFVKKINYNLVFSLILVILITDVANISYRQIITQVIIASCVSVLNKVDDKSF